MTIWDKILTIRFKFHKARVVSRFVNSLQKKCINSAERRLTPIVFYRKGRDEKEISVHCIDKFIANFHRQHKKIWQKGDHTFKKAYKKRAVARGDMFVKEIEKICYDKEKRYKLFLVPDLLGSHCNIKPTLEDFHEDDVRVAKLADISHVVFRD